MIDINELRRLAQAATPGPDGVSLNWLKLLQDFQKEANPAVINELLDRLEDAESDALEQARLNGMGASREAALMARLEAAEKERAIDEQRIADLMDELNRVGHENDALRSKNHQYEVRLRKILEEPENTMSNSKVLAEVIRQARLALGVKK